MRWGLSLSFVLALIALCGTPVRNTASAAQPRPVVWQLRLSNEAITPVTTRFIARALRQAEQQQAAALVIFLDTPGGLLDATRAIVNDILHSRIPVIVYVAPTGARAASAGVFITLAGHVAAMAPGTTIGAAHPVQVGGLPGAPPQQPTEKQSDEKKDEQRQPRATTPMEDKMVNDTAAWARALAELRGRNADWAARAVRESISAPAAEAAQERAVDFIATDLNDLLAQSEGREVKLLDRSVTLQLTNAEVRTHEMWWGERVLSALANPTLAFLLLMFGFYGILFELYTPGWGVPGTIGVICLMLGFFALAVLPINYVGLLLIVIALTMFVAEAFVTSYGFLSLGGVVCLVAGGLMLIDSPPGFMRIPLWTLVPVALATAAITFFLVGHILKAQRAPLQTGSELLVEAAAVAAESFVRAEEHYAGLVRTHGELWKAVCATPVVAGDSLTIEGREGLTLRVKPAGQSGAVVSINREQKKNIA